MEIFFPGHTQRTKTHSNRTNHTALRTVRAFCCTSAILKWSTPTASQSINQSINQSIIFFNVMREMRLPSISEPEAHVKSAYRCFSTHKQALLFSSYAPPLPLWGGTYSCFSKCLLHSWPLCNLTASGVSVIDLRQCTTVKYNPNTELTDLS